MYRNSRASVWSPPKSKRFVPDRSSCHDGPEPATYNPSDVDSIGGNYIVSKFKNLGIKRFVTPTQRLVQRLRIGKHGVSLTFLGTPGPGSYVLPSDFGILESKRGAERGGGTAFFTKRAGSSMGGSVMT